MSLAFTQEDFLVMYGLTELDGLKCKWLKNMKMDYLI